MNDNFPLLWKKLPNNQKIQLVKKLRETFLSSQESKFRMLSKILEPIEDSEKIGLWNLLEDSEKLGLWNLLEDSEKLGLWNLLKDSEKLGLWNLLEDSEKLGLWNLLKDSKGKCLLKFLLEDQIINLWKLLNSQGKVELKTMWELLNDEQKAIILEMESRPYSLSHIVFSMRNFIEDILKNNKYLKKHGFENVYVLLEESDGTYQQGNPKAVVFARIETYESNRKTLYVKIVYDTIGGVVKYDNTYISKQCSRFFMGHEVAHMILDINNIIDHIVRNPVAGNFMELPLLSSTAEPAANIFANILSDLRDLRILKKCLGDKGFPSEEDVVNSYQEDMTKQKINNPKDILEWVVNLNNESKNFTMSNSIFATKKIMGIIYGEEQRRISLIYPTKINKNQRTDTHINSFKPAENNQDSFGYAILLPDQDCKSQNLNDDSLCIAKAIGALLLNYDIIKQKESGKAQCEIPINGENFDEKRLERFAQYLSKAREKHLNNLVADIESKERIINIKKQGDFK